MPHSTSPAEHAAYLPGRRRALTILGLGGIGSVLVPAVRAQETAPLPQVTTPPPPQITTPLPPSSPPVPPRPATPAPAAIDRTKAHYVFFDQNIDVNSMRALRRQLTTLVEAGVSEITIVLHSAGGLIDPMLVTYSFIQALPAKINMHATGFVQSAATLLFLAGAERSADRNVRFLFHPSQIPLMGSVTEQQLQDRLVQVESVVAVSAEVFRDRTTVPEEEIARFGREQVIFTAEQALRRGIVQSVADLRIPGDGKSKIVFME